MFVMTFCLEISIETLANHKYLNIWLIISNLFAAYGIWRLWLLKPSWFAPSVPARSLSSSQLPSFSAALIDLFAIHNCVWIQLKHVGDPVGQMAPGKYQTP